MRIALNPLVSTMGYLLPFLMSGSIIVSVVLSLPTEGPLLLRSLLSEDLFMSATILFVLGALTGNWDSALGHCAGLSGSKNPVRTVTWRKHGCRRLRKRD